MTKSDVSKSGKFIRNIKVPTFMGMKLQSTVAMPANPPAAMLLPMRNRFSARAYIRVPARNQRISAPAFLASMGVFVRS